MQFLLEQMFTRKAYGRGVWSLWKTAYIASDLGLRLKSLGCGLAFNIGAWDTYPDMGSGTWLSGHNTDVESPNVDLFGSSTTCILKGLSEYDY